MLVTFCFLLLYGLLVLSKAEVFALAWVGYTLPKDLSRRTCVLPNGEPTSFDFTWPRFRSHDAQS